MQWMAVLLRSWQGLFVLKFGGILRMTTFAPLYFKEHGWRIIPFGDNGRGDAALELLGLDEFAKGKTSLHSKMLQHALSL